MGRKNKSIAKKSKHIKTRIKKSQINRKIFNYRMDNIIKDVNTAISNQPTHIQHQQMTLDQLKKLLISQNNNEEEVKKVKVGKLSVVDTQYLQKLLEKYGNQYQKMVKDAKLNKMQWTVPQIKKKHKAYIQILKNN